MPRAHRLGAASASGPPLRVGRLSAFHDLDPLGERVEECAAVPGREDSGVEDDHATAVGLAADEAAEALLELDDGAGEGIVAEGVAAAVLDGFAAGLGEGPVWGLCRVIDPFQAIPRR